ncbi:WD REPEATS REGION domain-containing protein [Citrus sinensis]|uniref:WD REPEATS REGION domain-containing protein n=1 Tax=Citrus sinensis TaxID=2711 RepID=A0ACB8M533_CITSI|nr:WD REPEATS REGION domain-containing protein [Citrus sinensis]
MASRFQAATLATAPCYPNAIAWSDENLIAVGSGHLVIILNPALPFGPRGLITIPDCEPYPIGVVKREELLSDCLLSTSLNRDRRPSVRSISWSPIGMAPNSGCLLAVCTTEGHVKIYRPPFCDFGAEWIEVVDISDRLYDYLAIINFGEPHISSAEFPEEKTPEHEPIDDLPNSVPRKERKRRRVNTSSVINGRSSKDSDVGSCLSIEMARIVDFTSNKMKDSNTHPTVAASKSKGNSITKIPSNCCLPLITADQYASRSAMLHSLAVAWSPVLRLSSKKYPVPQNGSSNWFSILAVGGRSGKVSLWRICVPKCYSVEDCKVPTTAVLIGLFQAHNSWITSISLAVLSSDSSNPQVLLVTGSSDGSVRIWDGYIQELLKSAEAHCVPFSLLKEVVTVNTVPISVLSLILPVQSPRLMLLAVGKGSGSFDLWKCDISCNKFDKVGSYNAHDQVVTGLAWAFDGCCLYSCSQDNFVRSWIFHGNSLSQVSIPTNTPGLQSCTDLPDAFVSCLGMAVSPGNLVVAMVRNFDLDALDHMYQARAQRSAIEFFWIGGQQLDVLSNTFPKYGHEACPDFSEKELSIWESNILWSLQQYEDLHKPLVVWDLIGALLAFKRSIPQYVECTLLKWLSSLYLGSLSSLYLGSHVGLSMKTVLSHVSKSVSKISSRQLHLINIILRRVILAELKADQINSKLQNLEGIYGSEEEQLTVWMELLLNSEKELRERLVGFSFSAFISLGAYATSTCPQTVYWCPDGIAQMEQWVAHNHEHVRDQLKVLASEVAGSDRRSHPSKYVDKEQCTYCTASVPFDSPEVAVCRGLESSDGDNQKHKLVRCSVSMQVCPATPLWFCKCCQRWTSKLAPESLFIMPRYPDDFKSLIESSVQEETPKPFCPLCGILLQRLQPEFLLSPSPV